MADLPVYFEQRLVGTIAVNSKGPSFTYSRRWLETKGAFPISTTMPLRQERYGPEIFLPWAANLLPESIQLRTLGQLLGTAPSDVIGLLTTIGRDTAGALSIGKSGGTSLFHTRALETVEDLERIIGELPSKPFLAGEEGISVSLAGVQSKLAVAVEEAGRICIPLEGAPSTHILRPDAGRLRGSVQNEAFCLSLAKRLGIPTPQVTTGKAGNRTYLLVTRYDRALINGSWRRLHQEDFCQVLGKPPSSKYESNQTGIGGPTLSEMFAATRRLMLPTEIVRLLDMVVFNVIVCNTDAHAKNYSIMINAKSASLAPLYDVMCSQVWEHVTKNLAQKIAGESRGENLKGRDWARFAKECGLGARQVLLRVRTLARLATSEAGAAEGDVARMPAGDHPVLKRTREAVEARAHTLLAQLNELAEEPTPEPMRSSSGKLTATANESSAEVSRAVTTG